MKQKTKFYLLSCILIFTGTASSNIFDIFSSNDQKVVIVGDVQKREHALEILKKEKKELSSEEAKKEANQIQLDLNKTNKLIADYKAKLSQAKPADEEYINMVLSVLNETAQLLLDTQLLQQKLSQTIDSHINIIESYLKDPNFKSARTEVSSAYSFEDLQKMYQNLLSINEKTKQQADKLEVLKKEQIDAKQEASTISKELKEKETEQINFNKNEHSNFISDASNWGVEQEAKLLDFEAKLLTFKKAWSELKVKELSYQVGLSTSQLEILNSKKNILSDDLETVDSFLKVNDTEVQKAQEELVKKKSEAAKIQSQLSKDIGEENLEKKLLQKEFETLSSKANLDISNPLELDDWNIDTEKYPSKHAIYDLAYLNENINKANNEIKKLEAEKMLVKVKLAFEEVMVKIITSWHKISQGNLRSEEDIEKEIAKYANNQAEGQRIMVSYRDKQAIVSKNINNLSKSLTNLDSIIKKLGLDPIIMDLQKDRTKLESIINDLKNKQTNKYSNNRKLEVAIKLGYAAGIIQQRIKLNRDLTDIYTSIIEIEKNILRQVEIVEKRLGKISSVLQRSQHAISWENVKNIVPDLGVFFFGLKNVVASYASELSISNIWKWTKYQVSHPIGIFYLLLKLLALFLIFLLLNQIIIPIKLKLLSLRPRASNLGILWGIGLLVVETVSHYLLSFMAWVTIVILIFSGYISSLGLQALFYLASIPYLCVIANTMIKKLIRINNNNQHIIIHQSVEARFTRVLSFFLYSTITILLFINAFELIAYKSDLTLVLYALYSVIFRAAIIFLIDKDTLIGALPKRGAIWDIVRSYIDNYYYPLLVGIVALMVISDPYILGFSKLVSFVFWGTILTLMLLIAVRFLQIQIRKITNYTFFYSTDAGSRERFSNAKTWYGLVILVTYFAIAAICILLLAKVWGYEFYVSDLYKWLDVELFNIPDGKETIKITPESFIVLIMYLILGVWLAWAFSYFVLKRVFSILLVDSGAQNTVATISRYFITIIALSVGLAKVKLGGFIIYVFGALAFGLVWAIKDPVNDFIAYFIILLDRTVKIGDFIEVDDKIIGVVRKISPRSVLVRRKNSVNIVVPNSKLTTMSVYNWGYTRGFFAFNDLKVTVPYSANPKLVKEILQKVLSENLNILKSPAPIIRLEDFGDYGYVFLVRGFLSSINVLNQWDIVSDIRLEVVEQLRKAGIPIAAPLRLMVNHKEIKHMYNLEDKPQQADPAEDVKKESKE